MYVFAVKIVNRTEKIKRLRRSKTVEILALRAKKAVEFSKPVEILALCAKKTGGVFKTGKFFKSQKTVYFPRRFYASSKALLEVGRGQKRWRFFKSQKNCGSFPKTVCVKKSDHCNSTQQPPLRNKPPLFRNRIFRPEGPKNCVAPICSETFKNDVFGSRKFSFFD